MAKVNNNISERAKKAKNGVQLVYVLDGIRNSSVATDNGLTFETDKKALEFFFATFEKEYNYQNNKRRYPNLQERLSSWLRGLPSCISIDYADDDIIKNGLIWGVLDSPDGRKAEQFVNNWFSVLALRILQAAVKVGINPYQYTV